MSFPAYPKYRESGVEWLGEVPEHWEVRPLRGLAKEGQNAFIDGDWIESPFITDEGIRLIQTGNVGVGYYKEQGFRYISLETLDALGCTEIDPGDILICRLADPVGRACLAPALGSRMITSVDVCILKPRSDVNARFIVYMLSSAQYLGFMEGQCRGGTRDRVSRTFLGSVRVSVPSLVEQTNIARFLDRETEKIDGLVAEQQQLMELLQEKRQAIISHAVTRGLNPLAPMKSSDIKWLGDVPEHWSVVQLNRLVEAGRRITYGIVQPGERDERGRFMVRGQDYSCGWAQPEAIFKVSDAVEYPYRRARLKARDLVLTIVGAGVGNVGIVPEWLNGANITQTTARIAVDSSKAEPQYVAAVLQGPLGKRSVELYAKGAAQPGLNLEHVRVFPVTVPPLHEQREIVAVIEREAIKLDALAAEAQCAIGLLQERRTAMISAAVTGQIDVRALAEKQAA